MTRGLETGRVTEGHLLSDHGSPTPPKAKPLAGRTPGSVPPARGRTSWGRGGV